MASAVKIVTFSGIDGAGKSTQISALEAWLRAAGLRTRVLTFWDDVVVLSRLREFILGGVTRGILKSMPVPVLMSH